MSAVVNDFHDRMNSLWRPLQIACVQSSSCQLKLQQLQLECDLMWWAWVMLDWDVGGPVGTVAQWCTELITMQRQHSCVNFKHGPCKNPLYIPIGSSLCYFVSWAWLHSHWANNVNFKHGLCENSLYIPIGSSLCYFVCWAWLHSHWANKLCLQSFTS